MRLTQIYLRNVRCFTEASLDLGRITLLLGPNSSGKTSVLASVLAAIQSQQFPLVFSLNGDMATLGDYRDIANRHDSSKEIAIRLAFEGTSRGQMTVEGRFDRSADDHMPLLKSCSYTDDSFSLSAARLESGKYQAEWQYDETKDVLARDLLRSDDLRALAFAVARLTQPRQRQGKRPSPASAEPDEPQVHPLGKPESGGRFTFGSPRSFLKAFEGGTHFVLMQHIAQILNGVREFGTEFNYIGSFREEPARTYYQAAGGDQRVERSGGRYTQQIADWELRDSPRYRRLVTALRKLGLLKDLRTGRLKGGRYEVRVRLSEGGTLSPLTDVGFGISQLLPFMVADMQLAKGATLAISQPEIHLHPSIQAELGDFFADRVLRDKRNYVLETHSEYLVNRLRLLIVKKRLRPEDVAPYYFEPGPSGPIVHRLTFTPDGVIEGAPSDYFRTYSTDVMRIALEGE